MFGPGFSSSQFADLPSEMQEMHLARVARNMDDFLSADKAFFHEPKFREMIWRSFACEAGIAKFKLRGINNYQLEMSQDHIVKIVDQYFDQVQLIKSQMKWMHGEEGPILTSTISRRELMAAMICDPNYIHAEQKNRFILIVAAAWGHESVLDILSSNEQRIVGYITASKDIALKLISLSKDDPSDLAADHVIRQYLYLGMEQEAVQRLFQQNWMDRLVQERAVVQVFNYLISNEMPEDALDLFNFARGVLPDNTKGDLIFNTFQFRKNQNKTYQVLIKAISDRIMDPFTIGYYAGQLESEKRFDDLNEFNHLVHGERYEEFQIPELRETADPQEIVEALAWSIIFLKVERVREIINNYGNKIDSLINDEDINATLRDMLQHADRFQIKSKDHPAIQIARILIDTGRIDPSLVKEWAAQFKNQVLAEALLEPANEVKKKGPRI